MEARFAGGGIILVIEHSQQLQFWQGEMTVVEEEDEYEGDMCKLSGLRQYPESAADPSSDVNFRLCFFVFCFFLPAT